MCSRPVGKTSVLVRNVLTGQLCILFQISVRLEVTLPDSIPAVKVHKLQEDGFFTPPECLNSRVGSVLMIKRPWLPLVVEDDPSKPFSQPKKPVQRYRSPHRVVCASPGR